MGLRFGARLFRRKNLEEARSLKTPLKRCLTLWHMIFYGIAHMAGAGIYVLAGTIVKTKAGPAASLSFLLCAFASLFTGLCYVEFSTLVPRAGSCYTFTYLTLGELPAFVVGWTMIADMIIGLASVAKAFSSTLDSLVDHAVSNWTTETLGSMPESDFLDSSYDVVAAGLLLSLMLVTVAGASLSMSLNVAMSGAQCVVLLMIGVCCFVYGDSANWSASRGGFFPFGVSGVINGATIAIFAFSGFEALANASEECKDPRRVLPLALMASLGSITVLYLGASLGLSYLQHYSRLDIGSPFVSGFKNRGAAWMQYVAGAGTLLATGATKLTGVYVLPRMLYALASDGVIFSCFSYVHPGLGVPLVGLCLGGLLSTLLALFFNLRTLANFVSMGVLLSYVIVGIDLFYLRYFYFHSEIAQEDSSDQLQPPDLAACQVKFANLRYLRPWASRLANRWPKLLFCLRRHGTLKILFILYIVGCLWSGCVLNYVAGWQTWWSWTTVGLSGCWLSALAACLCAYEPHQIDGVYCAPLMPLPPLASLFVNSLLLVRLQWLTWLRFFIWMTFGLGMYASYGWRNSRAESCEYVPLSGEEGAGREPAAADAESTTSDEIEMQAAGGDFKGAVSITW